MKKYKALRRLVAVLILAALVILPITVFCIATYGKRTIEKINDRWSINLPQDVKVVHEAVYKNFGEGPRYYIFECKSSDYIIDNFEVEKDVEFEEELAFRLSYVYDRVNYKNQKRVCPDFESEYLWYRAGNNINEDLKRSLDLYMVYSPADGRLFLFENKNIGR